MKISRKALPISIPVATGRTNAAAAGAPVFLPVMDPALILPSVSPRWP